eukprot:Skav207956  [mRNA]  locus=scaffold108:449724:453764:+ [translate_table: standard]
MDVPGPVFDFDHRLNLLFRGDAVDWKWMQLVPCDSHVIVSVSSPCPPWCTTSEKDGLLHEDGMILPRVLLILRYLNPKAIALENVHAICQHRHFPTVLGLLKWCGYSMSWQKASELRSVAPVSRKRWLAVFTRTCEQHQVSHGFDLADVPFLSLASFRALIPLPEQHERDLTLDRDLIGFYGDSNLVGKFGKRKLTKSRRPGEGILKSRCRKPSESLATIMAMHGEQHLLPLHYLQKNGLFTELFDGRYGPRFFSPMELAILHGVVVKLAVPAAGHSGHHAVGNCIAVPHAVQALAVLRRIVDERCNSHPVEAVMKCMQLRLHSGNSTIQFRDGHFWLVPNDQAKLHLYENKSHADLNAHDPWAVELVRRSQGVTAQETTTVEASPTLPYDCHVMLHVEGVLGKHAIPVTHGTTIAAGLQQAHLNLCPDMAVVKDGILLLHEHAVTQDMTIRVGFVSPLAMRLLKHGATWYVLQPGTQLRHVLAGLPMTHKGEQFMCCTLGGDVLSPSWFAVERTMVLLLPDVFHFENTWKCCFNHEQSVTAICRNLMRTIPEIFVSSGKVCIRAFDMAAFDHCQAHALELVDNMIGLFHQLNWTWMNVDDPPVIGHFTPGAYDAAPVHAIQFLLLRGLMEGFLHELSKKSFDRLLVRFEFQSTLLWQGELPVWVTMDLLTRPLSIISQQAGFGNTVWTCRNDPLDAATMLVHLRSDSDAICIRIDPATPLRFQGGGKLDVWKECKNLLGKELITRGWPIVDLDEITTEWLRAIGVNKVFGIMKQQMSPDKRWNNLVDSAKWAGLQTVPNDPVKMKAIRTIQKAVRQKAPVKLDVSNYTLSPGFFTCEDGSDLAILPTIALDKSGIHLSTWDEALQWITKKLPVVPDELAILTFFRETIPDDAAAPSIVTFPALDQFGRRVVLKGHLWQLGEKCVMTAHKNHQVAMPDTMVLACTLWRDECSPDQWEQATRNLVKTAFTFLESADPSSCVLQVWGRSYRDTKSKVEASAAVSGQFHMRVYTSKVENFLRLSGKACVYLTPKDANHLSHPGWGLLWMADKVEAEIAAQRATEQSGLARTHAKFALRVKAASLEAVAAEVKPSQKAPAFPVVHLFKAQPFPAELVQDQVIEWASQLGWRIKVLKRLGQHAYLLGAATKPPHDHMSLNGNLILIKEVHNGKKESKPTAFIAGPKPIAKSKSDHAASSQSMLADDPWATYLENQGRTPLAPKPAQQPPAAKALEGPIQAKFAALEQRMQSFENDLNLVRAEGQKVVNAVGETNQRIGHVEDHIQAMQNQMSTAIEKAMSKGMREQEEKLDAQFASIMQALSGNAPKRTNDMLDDDDDYAMDTPTRQPTKK